MIVKMEHVLILVIAAFVLYHFSRCNCGNGFSIGNLTRCYGNNERSCNDNLTICNWYNDKCHVINCSTYNNDIGACRNEEICTPLPRNDDQGSICARYGHHHNSEESTESSDEESGHEEADEID